MDDYRRLYAWQRAHALSVALHSHSRRIRERTYPGLCDRLRRVASGIPQQIVEGARHGSGSGFQDRVEGAIELARELECQLEMVRDLGALPRADALELLRHTIEVKRLLLGVLAGLRPLTVGGGVPVPMPRGPGAC
jgi:four helix bundle protein